MAEISAAAVKALREKTGLPMMQCKQALQQTAGNEQAAIDWLRKENIKVQETRIGRETAFGRMGLFVDWDRGVGALVELQCESAPVAVNAEFVQLANDMARQLATGPGAATPGALLEQPSPGKAGPTLGARKDDLAGRIREIFNLSRIARFDGRSAGYVHHAGKTVGVLLEVSGGNPEAAKDVAMHIAAMNPQVLSKEELPAAEVQRERDILTEGARKEGKPENIIGKMVEGRLRNFFAQKVLLEQPFVKDDKKTVGKVAQEADMKLVRFVHWELGK